MNQYNTGNPKGNSGNQVTLPSLFIADHNIRMVDGLYSLNDLHKASGSNKKHQPSNFLRLDTTQALIHEIDHSSDVRSGDNSVSHLIINGGNNRGTYVCKELVYAYAMWISAKFHLMVIRAFDNLVTQNYHSKTPTPKPVSHADWKRYLTALTIPEMAKLTDHTEKAVISGLYHATHSEAERQAHTPPTQQALFADQSVPAHIQKALDQFWQTISQLDLEQINHSNDPNMLAINLPEVYRQAGDKLPPKRSMLSALKNSIMPRFYESNHAINSRIKDKTVKTWVFVMPNGDEVDHDR